MEVFGLLNLLKNALETAPEQSPAAAPPTETPSSPPPATNETVAPRNPYLDFAAAHDARARKIKRK